MFICKQINGITLKFKIKSVIRIIKNAPNFQNSYAKMTIRIDKNITLSIKCCHGNSWIILEA